MLREKGVGGGQDDTGWYWIGRWKGVGEQSWIQLGICCIKTINSGCLKMPVCLIDYDTVGTVLYAEACLLVRHREHEIDRLVI